MLDITSAWEMNYFLQTYKQDSMDRGLGGLRDWWWTGRPGVLQFMGLQRVGHDWVTELNWSSSDLIYLSWQWNRGLSAVYSQTCSMNKNLLQKDNVVSL